MFAKEIQATKPRARGNISRRRPAFYTEDDYVIRPSQSQSQSHPGAIAEILKDVRVNILITGEPLYIGHLGLGDRNKWPLSRGRHFSQCMDVLSAGTKKVAVVERWPLGSTVSFSLWLLRNRVTRNGYQKGVVEVVAWGNVSQQWMITQIVLTQQGEIQEFFIGGGDPNFGSERTVELFCGKLLLPTPPPTSHGCTL